MPNEIVRVMVPCSKGYCGGLFRCAKVFQHLVEGVSRRPCHPMIVRYPREGDSLNVPLDQYSPF